MKLKCLNMVATHQGKVRGKIVFKVMEKSGEKLFSISGKSQGKNCFQGQGNVKEFDNLSVKIDILKIVRENWDLSGKTNGM